jgi:uncharacterized protein YkwD
MRTPTIASILVCVGLLPLAVQVRGGDASPGATGSASGSVSTTERGIRDCANRNRRARGLAPLRSGGPLNRAARLHARNMARHGFFSHTDLQGRGPTERVAIFDRTARFALVGENIAAGYRSVAAACRGWMNSEGHRENILGSDWTHVGGGFARGGPYGRCYVQVFAALSSNR